ncbi:hypothetical protein CC78DRAFT_317556 [Lojkania enalia]|uniref:Uncharacterized protein n=1 Tax=Lojkania enalia TaxID=147567 RepID=A0A9P4K7L4_9PLEO|nr:hypothetical protein CC78DRAFT_317556 [Didymosphaeria enalia]
MTHLSQIRTCICTALHCTAPHRTAPVHFAGPFFRTFVAANLVNVLRNQAVGGFLAFGNTMLRRTSAPGGRRHVIRNPSGFFFYSIFCFFFFLCFGSLGTGNTMRWRIRYSVLPCIVCREGCAGQEREACTSTRIIGWWVDGGVYFGLVLFDLDCLLRLHQRSDPDTRTILSDEVLRLRS